VRDVQRQSIRAAHAARSGNDKMNVIVARSGRMHRHWLNPKRCRRVAHTFVGYRPQLGRNEYMMWRRGDSIEIYPHSLDCRCAGIADADISDEQKSTSASQVLVRRTSGTLDIEDKSK
jgi:hypothetical protein